MRSKTTVEGLDKLKDKLLKLAAEMEADGMKAVIAAGATVRDDMKSNAPVDTGRLRDNINASPGADGKSVEVGPSDDVEYALAVEFGTSDTPAEAYAVPAAEQARSAFPAVVAATVKRGLPK